MNWKIWALIIGGVTLGIAYLEKVTGGMISNLLKGLGVGLGYLGVGVETLLAGFGRGIYGLTYYPLIAFPQALREWKELLFGGVSQAEKPTLVSPHSPHGMVSLQELGLNKSNVREYRWW